jgi:hypothetical protein
MKIKSILLIFIGIMAFQVSAQRTRQVGEKTFVQGYVSFAAHGVVVFEKRHGSGSYFAVTNAPTLLTNGKYFVAEAKFAGVYDWNGTPLELWDCSTKEPVEPVVYVAPPVPLTPEQIKAIAVRNEKEKRTGEAAALKWNQSQADKGDAYGELRMGERYLKGDGVEKDLLKAKDYFSKSAAQGNLEASNALVKIVLVSINIIPAGAP